MVEQREVLEGEVLTTETTAMAPRSVLSPDRAERLKECEEIVDRGLLAFQEVGLALQEIQDKKLWVDQYGSWDDYLDRRWSFKASRARQLMRAVDVSEELVAYADQSNIDTKVSLFPEGETQIRALTAFRRNDLRWRAWEKACELAGEGKQPTQDQVRAAVKWLRSEMEPQPEVRPTPALTRRQRTISIGFPLENAARAMRGFYTYTELQCLSLLIKQKG